jgi:hypothetical protein
MGGLLILGEKGTDLFFYSKAALRVRTRVVKINLSPFSFQHAKDWLSKKAISFKEY